MMDKDQLLHKYLTQTLTDEERNIFNELLKEDEAFREEVDLLQDLQKVTEFNDDSLAKEMVSEFEAEHRNKNVGRKAKIWWVAASVILLVGLAYFVLQAQVDTQELFSENFEPYRNVVHPITRGVEDQDTATEAFRSYEKGEFQKALNSFEALYFDTQTPYYLFYKANVLLELDRPDDAIVALQLYLKTEDRLTEKAYWYLAMAYLKLDDIENAKKSLRESIAQNKYNVEKAKSLLKELD